MWHIIILIGILLCAIQAVCSKRLLVSALWLAGTSALVALMMYLLDAPEIAVIELSVGAGLVTVLFVFAINIAGEEPLPIQSIIPKPLSIGLVLVAVVLLGFKILPNFDLPFFVSDELDFNLMFWNVRSLDVLLLTVIIFAGVLGVLGLLSDQKTKHITSETEDKQS
jgi:uncharacterized MnhB-related membrane protein